MPALIKADEAHLINVSSVNGFWASLGPETPHTAYSAAKFAVKGFTEALTTDLKLNAPHVKASVVMPGHIGTNIALTTLREFGDDAVTGDMPGGPAVSPEEARQRAEEFRDNGTTSAEDAATIILDGVKEEKWRILVGPDAQAIDAAVRNAPENAYEPEFGLEIFQFIQNAQEEAES